MARTSTERLSFFPAGVVVCVFVQACTGVVSDGTVSSATTSAGETSSSTGNMTSTSSSDGGSATGETSTGTGTEVDCGAVCDQTWTHEGDLDLFWPDVVPADYTCLGEVSGRLQLWNFPGELPTELRSLQKVGVLDVKSLGASSLTGLDCVREAGGIYIHHSENLKDLSKIAGVTVSSFVVLIDNQNLVDASDISIVPSSEPARLDVYNNMSLAVLPFVASETSVDSIDIQGNPKLESLDPIAGFRVGQAGAMLHLENNSALKSIAPLSGIMETMPFKSITLHDLPALDSLSGLDGLRSVETLSIMDAPLVKNLAELSDLQLANRLVLAGMPLLADLQGLGDALEVGSLELGACGSLGIHSASLDGLDGVLEIGQLLLINSPSLSELPSIAGAVNGTIQSIDNPKLSVATVKTFADEQGISYCSQPPSLCGCY